MVDSTNNRKQRIAKLQERRQGLKTDKSEKGRGVTAADVGRSLGLAGRAVTQGVMSVPAIALDPINQMIAMGRGKPEEFVPMRKAVGRQLTALGVPSPETPIERVTGVVGEVVTPTGVTAGLAQKGVELARRAPSVAANAPQMFRNAMMMFADKPGQQLAGAAGAGLGSQLTAEAGGNALMQLLAGFGGGVAGAGAAGMRVSPTPTRAAQAAQEARARGINVYTSDVMRPEGFAGKSLRRAGEAIPVVGMSGPRAEQEKQRVKAVKDTLQGFGVDISEMSYDTIKKVTEGFRKGWQDKVTQLDKIKTDIINNLSSPTQLLTMPKTQQVLSAKIAELNAAAPQSNKPLIALLQQAQQEFSNKTSSQVEANRELYGELLSNEGLFGLKTAGQKVWSEVYKAINDDFGDFIETAGSTQQRRDWKQANTDLYKMILERENVPGVSAALNKGEMLPESSRNLLFSRDKGAVELLYRNLTPEGRDAGRQAILKKALDAAGRIDEPDAFNPDTFERQLDDLSRQIEVFFPGDDADVIEGLRKAIRLTRQATASRLAGGVATGQQNLMSGLINLLFTAGTGAAGAAGYMQGGIPGALAGMGAMVGTGLTFRGLESGPVRDILLQMGRVTNAKELAGLEKRLLDTIRAQSASEDMSLDALLKKYGGEAMATGQAFTGGNVAQ